ncbi:MAG: tRNA (adenosine(37)-N6)-dimethylallyltransferase MiaA [Acidobacteriaceae bacterium]
MTRATHPDPLLVLLLGPTASGKTALSLALAHRFHGEIVSCDSVAVYCECEIGSAKPTPAERAQIPHHLIDIFSPAEICSAGDYSRLARRAVSEITARHHLPIVTGGTGFYLRALTDGLFSGPPRSTEIRARLTRSAQRHRPGRLHRILTRLDPAAAARIHANDHPKLIRAIEVCLAARQPITAAWAAGRDPLTGYRILRIGLNPPRAALYDRINARAAAMFAHGLVEETQSIIARHGAAIPVLDALGYRQARQLLSGELTREQAIAAAQQGHRNYAKRQLTWFRRETNVHWLTTFGDQPEALAAAVNLISEALAHPSGDA